ncbi:TPA: host nuclease inhibitor GamL, partial [Klebsiella pneumoniae subsp. pneumoniae]|nr:host nuclease inhibitor GamL [Klebsiella pneumoniae subsp. pneumoniae]
MNAYRAYDVIEERKWAEQTLDEAKEKWIDDRAKEVFDSLPEDPYVALRQSVSSKAFPYEG